MPKFYSWRKVAKALNGLGFGVARQRGSHFIFENDGKTVPVPRDEEIVQLETFVNAKETRPEVIQSLWPEDSAIL